MKTVLLITRLIQQDLKHNQLLAGLEALGFTDNGLQHLSIHNLIEKLMQVQPEAHNSWSSVYFNFLERAQYYPLSPQGEALLPLAEDCYRQLQSVLGCPSS
ncbi:MAG TPA: hypothetical protein DCG19_06565 [Cryomorphaceae bacterium]|nr:hypothetical protein [Owenweeksia sp.]MBF98129.1 hypothetical protein [Owenweeksia sp.]HAD97051.1 hypothetical protein [Cryomorphaceae bacterium]|tara:strand:+ start:2875 stop:3177 length:303 start_codon:yes stop_codon:yes gene_type:complete